MPRYRRLSLTLSALLLTACALFGQATHDNYLKVQNGMSEAEVYALLGEPEDVLSLGFGELGGGHAIWKNQGATMTIQFLNGKVVGKQYTTFY